MPKTLPPVTLTFAPGQEQWVTTSRPTKVVRSRTVDGKTQRLLLADGVYVEPAPEPTGKVVPFPVTGTPAQLLALMRDETIDVIELQAGTYPRWSFIGQVARTRPLLIRPKGDVIWDGTGTVNAPPWRIGWTGLMSNVTFAPSGTGTFTAQNYKLGKAGVLMTKWVENVAFDGVTVRGCEGGHADATGPQHTHTIYLDSDGTHRSKGFRADGWVVEGPANRWLSGLHIYHRPSTDGVVARAWRVRNLHRAVYAYLDATDVLIEGWVIADCNGTIDTQYESSQGVVRNCKATNAGPMAPGKGYWLKPGMVDGGGNVSG